MAPGGSIAWTAVPSGRTGRIGQRVRSVRIFSEGLSDAAGRDRVCARSSAGRVGWGDRGTIRHTRWCCEGTEMRG